MMQIDCLLSSGKMPRSMKCLISYSWSQSKSDEFPRQFYSGLRHFDFYNSKSFMMCYYNSSTIYWPFFSRLNKTPTRDYLLRGNISWWLALLPTYMIARWSRMIRRVSDVFLINILCNEAPCRTNSISLINYHPRAICVYCTILWRFPSFVVVTALLKILSSEKPCLKHKKQNNEKTIK